MRRSSHRCGLILLVMGMTIPVSPGILAGSEPDPIVEAYTWGRLDGELARLTRGIGLINLVARQDIPSTATASVLLQRGLYDVQDASENAVGHLRVLAQTDPRLAAVRVGDTVADAPGAVGQSGGEPSRQPRSSTSARISAAAMSFSRSLDEQAVEDAIRLHASGRLAGISPATGEHLQIILHLYRWRRDIGAR